MKTIIRPICLIILLMVLSDVFFALFLLTSWTGAQELHGEDLSENGEKIDLVQIPLPQMEHFEKAVRNQLREGHKIIDSITSTPSVSLIERARAFGELGHIYHAYHLNDAAEACYHNAIILDPSSFKWNYSMGYLFQSTGSFSKAIEHYQRSLDSQPNSYLVLIRLGECYRSLNQLTQAKQSFEAAFQVNPNGPAVMARLGEIALAEKNFAEAVEYLESALKSQPAANMLHYPLAIAYRGLGKLEEANHHLSKQGMVGVQPPDLLKKQLSELVVGFRVYTQVGKLAFSAGRYNEAAEAFLKAVEADPDVAGVRINLGAALVKLQEYEHAISQFKEAVSISPENVTARFNLGKILSYLGKYVAAINHLQVAVEKEPDDAQAHFVLANALQHEKSFEKAFEHYKEAVKQDPSMTAGWLRISYLLSLNGRHGEALRVLEEAHTRLPLNGLIAHALAHMLASSPDLSKRDGQRALNLANKVYKAMQNFEHARTVAMAYAELNLCDKAIEWQERAIDLAVQTQINKQSLKLLKRNLEHFKSQRPCRVPGER